MDGTRTGRCNIIETLVNFIAETNYCIQVIHDTSDYSKIAKLEDKYKNLISCKEKLIIEFLDTLNIKMSAELRKMLIKNVNYDFTTINSSNKASLTKSLYRQLNFNSESFNKILLNLLEALIFVEVRYNIYSSVTSEKYNAFLEEWNKLSFDKECEESEHKFFDEKFNDWWNEQNTDLKLEQEGIISDEVAKQDPVSTESGENSEKEQINNQADKSSDKVLRGKDNVEITTSPPSTSETVHENNLVPLKSTHTITEKSANITQYKNKSLSSLYINTSVYSKSSFTVTNKKMNNVSYTCEQIQELSLQIVNLRLDNASTSSDNHEPNITKSLKLCKTTTNSDLTALFFPTLEPPKTKSGTKILSKKNVSVSVERILQRRSYLQRVTNSLSDDDNECEIIKVQKKPAKKIRKVKKKIKI